MTRASRSACKSIAGVRGPRARARIRAHGRARHRPQARRSPTGSNARNAPTASSRPSWLSVLGRPRAGDDPARGDARCDPQGAERQLTQRWTARAAYTAKTQDAEPAFSREASSRITWAIATPSTGCVRRSLSGGSPRRKPSRRCGPRRARSNDPASSRRSSRRWRRPRRDADPASRAPGAARRAPRRWRARRASPAALAELEGCRLFGSGGAAQLNRRVTSIVPSPSRSSSRFSSTAAPGAAL